jgi:hypothetical protein
MPMRLGRLQRQSRRAFWASAAPEVSTSELAGWCWARQTLMEKRAPSHHIGAVPLTETGPLGAATPIGIAIRRTSWSHAIDFDHLAAGLDRLLAGVCLEALDQGDDGLL